MTQGLLRSSLTVRKMFSTLSIPSLAPGRIQKVGQEPDGRLGPDVDGSHERNDVSGEKLRSVSCTLDVQASAVSHLNIDVPPDAQLSSNECGRAL